MTIALIVVDAYWMIDEVIYIRYYQQKNIIHENFHFWNADILQLVESVSVSVESVPKKTVIMKNNTPQ